MLNRPHGFDVDVLGVLINEPAANHGPL